MSYFSRLVDAQRFQFLVLSELYQRGMGRCGKAAAVVDWLQGLVNNHRPDAVRILDFPHAGQRITGIGQVLRGEGSPARHEPHLRQLKHAGPAALLNNLHTLHTQHPSLPSFWRI